MMGNILKQVKVEARQKILIEIQYPETQQQQHIPVAGATGAGDGGATGAGAVAVHTEVMLSAQTKGKAEITFKTVSSFPK